MFGFRGFPNVQGGIEAHAENLASQLAHLGHRVTACMRSPYVATRSEAYWRGVRRLRLGTVRNKYFETLLHAFLCTLVAGVRRPEVVHVHGIGSAHVIPLLRAFGLKVVLTHHGEDYKREKWGWVARRILRAGEILGVRFANRRIAVSRGICERVDAQYGTACDFIPNGVVLPDLPTNVDKVVELGLEPGRYVLTVGRLTSEKRQMDLLRAFADAKLEGWKLAVVGGSDHRSKYSDLLAEEARRTENVVMAGVQTGEALRQLFGHAAIFVLPSSHEGLPIALLEALSYGLPVLVSDIPANRELVADPARAFRVGDIPDLSAKLCALIALKLDDAGRETVRRCSTRQYDWTEIARRTSAIYDELVGGPAKVLPWRDSEPGGMDGAPSPLPSARTADRTTRASSHFS
jgi:glycosyltransferase involved in cell wall biosynthesis